MGNKSVFQFIENNEPDLDNLGVINGQTEIGGSTILREPEEGSYEELDIELSPKVGFARLRIKGTDRYVYVVIAAKANFA